MNATRVYEGACALATVLRWVCGPATHRCATAIARCRVVMALAGSLRLGPIGAAPKSTVEATIVRVDNFSACRWPARHVKKRARGSAGAPGDQCQYGFVP